MIDAFYHGCWETTNETSVDLSTQSNETIALLLLKLLFLARLECRPNGQDSECDRVSPKESPFALVRT
jgi:hypothetical protein